MNGTKALQKQESQYEPNGLLANRRIILWSQALSRAIGGLAIVVGFLVLLGWAFDLEFLKRVLFGPVAMEPNTAVATALVGIALSLLHSEHPTRRQLRFAQLGALGASLIGLITLSEYVFRWNIGVDQLLFAVPGSVIGMLAPGRMAPGAALNFVLLGTALQLIDTRLGYWSAQILAVVAAWIAFLAFLGHLYGAQLLYGVVCIDLDCAMTGDVPLYTAMALHTAVMLGALALGLLAARPNQGLMEVMSSDSAGGLLGRRVLPAAFAIPIAGGWLSTWLERSGFIEADLGAALQAGMNILAVGGLLWWSAQSLFQVDKQRRLTEKELAEAREREVDIGFRIQRALLFRNPPRDLPWARIAALTIPSDRIDGDFFDFLVHTDHCLDLILGDVMGKGVPAALLGAATKAHFLGALSHLITAAGDHAVLPEPKEIVTLAHSLVVKQLIEVESFVTVCYARFDLEGARLTLVDCGHTRTIHFQQQTGTCKLLAGNNLPIGFSEQEIYDQIVTQIAPGDVLVFYSDGLTEARNPQGDFFGLDRLVDLVQTHAALDPEGLVAQVRGAVEAFCVSESFADDLTCMTVKLQKPRLMAPLTQARLDISSDLKELTRIRAFIRSICSDAVHGNVLGEDGISALERAATEAASNIMIHAYGRRLDQPIELDAEVFADRVVVRLHHLGMSFDPQRVATPKLDGTQASGFGMYIIAKSVDEVRYYRDDRGRNCIALVKRAD
jgi:sigma-B regulation protein RsbU (phosphoserine phosphatase)